MPPGIYDIKVEHPGFRTVTSTNVEVQVQQSVRLDLTLQVGQVSETVEVSRYRLLFCNPKTRRSEAWSKIGRLSKLPSMDANI